MTHHIIAMLDAHPRGPVEEKEVLAACIGACFECAQACTACADSCLSEKMVADLAGCIRTDLDCADICTATGHVLSRQTATSADIVLSLLEACRAGCDACAASCEEHAHMHDHCRLCGEACRRCEAACAELLEIRAR